jgi:hypothetical protein
VEAGFCSHKDHEGAKGRRKDRPLDVACHIEKARPASPPRELALTSNSEISETIIPDQQVPGSHKRKDIVSLPMLFLHAKNI